MTFEEYATGAAGYSIEHRKTQRLGQAWFNYLAQQRPELANQIRGDVMYDPFYRDKNIGNFLDFVARNW